MVPSAPLASVLESSSAHAAFQMMFDRVHDSETIAMSKPIQPTLPPSLLMHTCLSFQRVMGVAVLDEEVRVVADRPVIIYLLTPLRRAGLLIASPLETSGYASLLSMF
jgi:hypothetical protein